MKTNTIAIIAASSAFFLLCIVMSCKQTSTKKTIVENELPPLTEISQTPKIEHGVNCDCDSLFGYKLCDTLNFGGVVFFGDKHPSGIYYNVFFFERTPITNTPYAIRLYSQSNCDWRKIEKCLSTNVKNFNWTPGHLDKNFKSIDLPKRFEKYVHNNNYDWAIGTQNGKEYFTSWYGYIKDGEIIHDEQNIIITDLKLLKQYEQEKYDSESPKREAEAREKIEEEKNAQIFPI